MPNFEKFKGGRPYGSELFGVFQPLLGWKSNQNKERILQEQENNVKALINSTNILEKQKQFTDPLADFDPMTQLAVLSPIGITHLFREYFFEHETFLGPPVGHVWISPGGVVELIEVNTRRTTTERMVETLFESNLKSELTTIEEEDLADAVTWENHRNIKFGISGSGVIYNAEACANIDFDCTHKLALESSHKFMREQSEKLSREICRNFKTTFRTSTEVQDSSSRRYVLENKSNKLLNYELHRKMRRVGVQVQHIGTQLCWQVYIGEPGKELGIAELVHITKPAETQSSVSENYQPQDHASYSEYVKAVRERIKFASNIRRRNSAELRDEERIVIYHRLLRQLMQIGPDQSIQVTSEIIRSMFDVDKMLYFAASDWSKPREHNGQQQSKKDSPDRPNYLITEESEPARLGSSLGWLLQLDGDNHRNAFLNSPWIKVVIPIFPGREVMALNWLKLNHVEGADGLDNLYNGLEPELEGKTIGESLQNLAKKISDLNTDIQYTLAAETVYESGFDSLNKGFQVTGGLFEVFDQWTEVLPTDQIVALEYDEHDANHR